MTTHIKEELLTAWKNRFGYDLDCVGTINDTHIIWAARWAMERCADKMDGEGQPGYATELRQLSKELS